MRELEKEALRIAREIEGEETRDLHLAEVNYIVSFYLCSVLKSYSSVA